MVAWVVGHQTTDLEVLSSNLFCELLFCFIFILFFIRLVSLKHYTRGGESDCFVILKTLIWDFLQEILFVALGCSTRCVWSTFLSLCPTTLGSAYDDICQHRYYIFGNPENRTLGSWVRSTNPTSVLCRPRWVTSSLKRWLIQRLLLSDGPSCAVRRRVVGLDPVHVGDVGVRRKSQLHRGGRRCLPRRCRHPLDPWQVNLNRSISWRNETKIGEGEN